MATSRPLDHCLLRILRLANGGEALRMSDVLNAVLEGLQCPAGAAFDVSPEGLELLSHAGLSEATAARLARLPSESSDFAVKRAADSRKMQIDTSGACGSEALAAMPIVVGRRAVGVLLAMGPRTSLETNAARVFLEAAAHTVALVRAREAEKPESHDRSCDVRTAQMAAIGMLAGGFASELSAPLSALSAHLKEHERLIATGSPDRSTLGDLVAASLGELARAERATSGLLAALGPRAPVALDLASVAREAVARSKGSPGVARADVTVDIEPGCWVSGRMHELSQVVYNLTSNALDACAESASPRVRVSLRADGPRVILSVEDSGDGVPVQLRARIFEPFFSTKESFGLGLALVKHAVHAQRGHIELARSPLGGSLFRIVLPATTAPDADAHSRPTKPSPHPAGARERTPEVLWIDDDHDFLRSIRRLMKRCEIQTAASAEQATAILAREPRPDLVFCDLGLPDGSGLDVYAEVARRDYELARRFVFVTGGIITSELADQVIQSGRRTLLKPVSPQEVQALVDQEGRRAHGPLPRSMSTLRAPEHAPEPPRSSATTKPEMKPVRLPDDSAGPTL